MNPTRTVDNIQVMLTAKQTRLKKTIAQKQLTGTHISFLLNGAVPCARKFMDEKGNTYYRPSIGRVIVHWKDHENGYASVEEATIVAQQIIRCMELHALPNMKPIGQLVRGEQFRLRGQRKFRTFKAIIPCVNEWRIMCQCGEQISADPEANAEIINQ